MSIQCPVTSHFTEANKSKMAFCGGAHSETAPSLLSIINKHHCGQLLSKFCCGKDSPLGGCWQGHLSVLQREASGFRVFPNVIFFLTLWASATNFQSHSLNGGDSWRVGSGCLHPKYSLNYPHNESHTKILTLFWPSVYAETKWCNYLTPN